MADPLVEQAIELDEWYSGWRHRPLVMHTAACFGSGRARQLSELGVHGTYLASDDLTSVLANYQAFAAKMENLDMLVGGCVSIAQLMESVAQGKTADDNVLLRSAFDRGICVAAPFQDESAQHFRCVVYEPCHKTVYILDSLNVRSVKLTRLVAMLNSLAVPEGWSVQRIRTGGQNDGWSCGLWSLYTVMLTGRYVLEAQRADVCLDQYIFMALANEGLHDKTTGDRFLHVYFRHLKDAVANEQPVYAFDFNPHQHLPRLQMIADKAHVNGKRDEKHEGGRTYAEATKCALPECTVTQDVVGSHLNPFLSAGGQQHQDQRDSAGRRRRRRRLR